MQNLFSPLEKIYKALYLFAYDITGNYGLALILLSFFTFIVLYPFNKKAQQIQNKEHKVQAILAPQISEIKKQYSGREQYEQLQWLYRRYGYHPLYAIRSALGLLLQIPFLTAAYYMLSGLAEIQGVSWGMIQNLGSPDHLLHGVNVLPFVMTLVTVLYAFVMPGISKKERIQTIAIGVFFLILLYSAPAALLIFWTCNLIWSLLDSLLSEKLAWVGEYVAENELAFHVIFALALTVGLLLPLEIYIKNASQLWFDLKDIGKYFLLDTIKYVVVLFFIYVVCCQKRIRNIYLALLLGLLLGVFLQSYIIGADYGRFDGHEIYWEDYTEKGIINTLIWFSCLLVGYIGLIKLKNSGILVKKIIKRILFIVIASQCINLLFCLVKYPIQNNRIFEDGKAGILTTKDMFTVSANSNIIVFLLDAFDASVFEELTENHRYKLFERFKDFTYYPDVISSYGFTHYSLPEILTGKLFQPGTKYVDFLHLAWNNNSFYRALKEKDYSVNLYTSGNYVYKNALIDNLVTKKILINSAIANKFIKLVKFRASPHYLKKIFYNYDEDIQNPVVSTNRIESYRFDDRAFYLNLQKGLNISQKGNCFQFYHLNGLHQPYILDENVELLKEGGKTAVYKQGLGVLKIVEEFINKMKLHNLYDNATIAIIADHGHHNIIGSRPVFLIKKADERNSSLVINDTPLIVSDLFPCIFEQFDRVKSEHDYMKRQRKRFYYVEGNIGQFVRYEVGSPAKNLKLWKSLGEVKNWSEVKDRCYVIGDVIDFSYFGNSLKYKGYGWGAREEDRGSVIAGNKAELILDLKKNNNLDKKNIFVVKVSGSIFYENHPFHGDIKILVNNQYLGKWRFLENTTEIECKIPNDILDKKNPLVLTFIIDKPSEEVGFNSLVFFVQKVQIVRKN